MSKPPGNKLRPTRRDYVVLFLGTVVTVGFLELLAFKHPSDYGVIPPCPFHAVMGLYCPGCGSMRATHYLMTGHPVTSLRYNPLVLLIVPLLVFSVLRWLGTTFMHREIPFPFQTVVYWAVVIVFLLFFLVRNIPLELLDVLRPPGR
jgi:hypothetical protein